MCIAHVSSAATEMTIIHARCSVGHTGAATALAAIVIEPAAWGNNSDVTFHVYCWYKLKIYLHK